MSSRWSRVRQAVTTATALLAASAHGEDAPQKKVPDFSSTQAEHFSNLGISTQAMSELLKVGDLVWVDYTPKSKKIPWLTTSATLVGAPAATVYDTIAQVEKYPSFMAQAKEVKASPVSQGVDEVNLAFALNAGVTEIINRYGLYYHYQPPGRVEWSLAWGDFDANVGMFEVLPVPGDPSRSILLHTSCALPRAKVLTTVFSRVPGLDIKVNLTAGLVLMKAIKVRAQGGVPLNLGGKDTPPLTSVADTLVTLSRGSEVVLVEHAAPRFFTGVTLIQQPADKVYRVISDWDTMGQSLPAWDATTLSRSAQGARVKVRATVPFIMDLDSDYTLAVTHTSPTSMRWVAEEGGDLEGLKGEWEVLPRGEQTLVFYRNTYKLASHGYLIRNILSTEPLFEDAIHVSETQQTVETLRRLPTWRTGGAGATR